MSSTTSLPAGNDVELGSDSFDGSLGVLVDSLVWALVGQATQITIQLVGLAILAGILAAVAAAAFRWYTREVVPAELALLVGLSGVAVYLNTTTALGQAVGGDMALAQDAQLALFHIAAFLAGSGGALVGRQVGDDFAEDVLLDSTASAVDREVSRLVQTVGRVVIVELPEEIEDIVGYDPVPEETKESLSGKRFVFPRNLTVEELESRLTARLKADYAVGHVDVDLAADGSIEYLAIGSRAAGIGPTLPPATNAVAIRADPAFAASSGDLVQVWETDPMRRVLTGELRGVADDVVTLAIDASDTPKLDPRRKYRLVTLPVEDRPEREFASLLRSADETFSSVTVEAGSPLHGLPAGAIDLTIVSVKPEDNEQVVLPEPEYVLAPGDVVFIIAKPERLRRLETAARPLDPSLVEDIGRPSVATSHEPGPATVKETPEAATESGPTPVEETPETATESGPAQPAKMDTQQESEEPAPTTPGDDGPIKGKADASTFEQLKAEIRGDEKSSADSETAEDSDEPVENGQLDEPETPSESESVKPAEEDTTGADAGGSTFEELKAEFDSGGADWGADEQPAPDESDDTEGGTADEGGGEPSDDSVQSGAEPASGDTGDDVVPLDEADISFGDDTHAGVGDTSGDRDDTADGLDDTWGPESDDDKLSSLGFEDDEDLSGLDFEEEDDDLSSLGFEADDDLSELDGSAETEQEDDLSDLDFEEESIAEEADEPAADDSDEDDDEKEDDEEKQESDDDDEDDDDDSGGGSTFAQLKEEFESGEADWADDVSDSPGGDMRLDE